MYKGSYQAVLYIFFLIFIFSHFQLSFMIASRLVCKVAWPVSLKNTYFHVANCTTTNTCVYGHVASSMCCHSNSFSYCGLPSVTSVSCFDFDQKCFIMSSYMSLSFGLAYCYTAMHNE